jgi:hypothetical protein
MNNRDRICFALVLRQPELAEATTAEPSDTDPHLSFTQRHVIHRSPSMWRLVDLGRAKPAPRPHMKNLAASPWAEGPRNKSDRGAERLPDCPERELFEYCVYVHFK